MHLKPPMHGLFAWNCLRSVQKFIVFLLAVFAQSTAFSQVYLLEDGRPWNVQLVDELDQEVGGWYLNLGITGIRVELRTDRKKAMLVKYVFKDSVANNWVEVGDWIVGVSGRNFVEEFEDGKFSEAGARGPMEEFSRALEQCQGSGGNGVLSLRIERNGKVQNVSVPVGKEYGSFSSTFPFNCPKSERLRSELLSYVRSQIDGEGGYGDGNRLQGVAFAVLALVNEGGAENIQMATRIVRFLAEKMVKRDHLDPGQRGGSIWGWLVAGVALSEYYLATGAEWVKPKLQEINEYLMWAQYIHYPAQVDFDSNHVKPTPERSWIGLGGWGHYPGFEGYGPISMSTGFGALALSMMQRCGIEVDQSRHVMAYDFLSRATDFRGWVNYHDGKIHFQGSEDGNGRTGVTALANQMCLYSDSRYRDSLPLYLEAIRDLAPIFLDTHASPAMGTGFLGMAAFLDPAVFREVMDENRWWFATAHTQQRTFYQQPGRQLGKTTDTRFSASAVAALILSLPKRNLWLTGKGEEFEAWVRETHPNNLRAFDPFGDIDRDGKSNWREYIESKVTPPAISPNPASFSRVPVALSSDSITMTATEGRSPNGLVEYRFIEVTGQPGATSSGWQRGRTYTDRGLEEGTVYGYRVQMRVGNFVGQSSGFLSARTQDAVGVVISPNPAAFANLPTPTGSNSVTMMAVEGVSASGVVEYRFTEVTGKPGGTSSGWQRSRIYTDGGLLPNTVYAYRVQMRVGLFEGESSGFVSVLTPDEGKQVTVLESQPFTMQSGWGYRGVLGLGGFDANGADKLVVVVSTENANSECTTR